MNLVDLALADLATAAALLRDRRSGVVGLDVRELRGGAQAYAQGPQHFDVYLGAIDAGLGRMRGLTNHGYILRKAHPQGDTIRVRAAA
jgi:hypothetical protein